MPFRGRGDRLVDFACDDLTVWFHRKRDRKCAVTRIGADLKIAPNAEDACKQRHELRLFGRKQHMSPGKLGRLFTNDFQRLRFAKAELHQILVKWVG